MMGSTTQAIGVRARRIFSGAVLLVVFFAASGSVFAEEDPAALIDRTVRSALDEFLERKEELTGNNPALLELLNRTVVPLFDFDRIARLILARSWKKAGPEQREAFAHEFKRLMIATYSLALFQYTGKEKVRIHEAEIKEKKQRLFATVRTEVILGDEIEPVPVDYFLIQAAQGESWKIYNLSVAGLNMVINYRGVFQATILDRGLDGTIASMKESNDRFMNP
ncbi:MAG: ABC transporter substrate-binding protein [Gammaproteobacteria bacterium]|nr:ABC transporter substrate-binding protein [Gammaproteobacteria bacterium]MYD76711.1 ABC transporter substrate-binding protein [Gammaproteobacteria bacterium]